MHVLITRPKEDALPLSAALADAGVETIIEPLLDIVYLDSNLPDLKMFQGLLVTSANGIRAFARLEENRELTVWAVGDASARCAREQGFADVRSASGDVNALAALVKDQARPEDGPLLHVAGTKLAGDLARLLEDQGFGYERCVLYKAETAERFSDKARATIGDGSVSGVMLYSPRTAATFCDLAKASGLDDTLRSMTAFCLSTAVADKVSGFNWKEIIVAPEPNEASLIAKVLEAATKV